MSFYVVVPARYASSRLPGKPLADLAGRPMVARVAERCAKSGATRVLVATDIAARGIDVDGISHVINYQIPSEPETYVHRIGRTARAGHSGHALSFCSQAERKHLVGIERLLKKPIPAEEDHAYHCPLAASPIRRPNREKPGGKSRASGRTRHRPRGLSWRRR